MAARIGPLKADDFESRGFPGGGGLEQPDARCSGNGIVTTGPGSGEVKDPGVSPGGGRRAGADPGTEGKEEMFQAGPFEGLKGGGEAAGREKGIHGVNRVPAGLRGEEPGGPADGGGVPFSMAAGLFGEG